MSAIRAIVAAWQAAALLLVLATVANAAGPSVTLRHSLWDANQRPLYQTCANAFQAANPDIRIRIQQVGWDDYWPALATGFVSGTAPDVFTNHLTRFTEYVQNGVMLDLAPLVKRDRVAADSLYEPGLIEMWRHEGRQYGLPTDWDTIALVVNLEHLHAAGLSLAELQQLHWNPRDGGSFGRVLERLTLDDKGRRGDEPGFDRRHVRVYGYQNPSNGGMMGQAEWSHFAYSAGWRFQSRPWDGALRYDDPIFIATLDWLASLPQKGVSASRDAIGRLGADALFLSGRAAIVPFGSWMIDHYLRQARIKFAWVPLPVGPTGHRATMLNSLALSIWSGSRQPEAAWRWLRYVASPPCQALLAPQGVVFPSVRGMGQIAADAQSKRGAAQHGPGANTQVFIDAARSLTFQPPMVAHGSEVTDLMASTLDRVLAGSARASQALPEAARKVREITSAP